MFIDEATGAPSKFDIEVYTALQLLPDASKLCVLAGAAYLAKVLDAAVTRHIPSVEFKRVGTASLQMHLPNWTVYCQAVNDRYTEEWPLPWIIGADRKKVVGWRAQPGTMTAAQAKEILDTDLAVFSHLYQPSNTEPQDELVVRVAQDIPGFSSSPSGGPVMHTYQFPLVYNLGGGTITSSKTYPVRVVAKVGRVSPVQQLSLEYPFKAPHRVTNYLGASASPVAQPPVISQPVTPAGPKEKTLAEVLAERRKQSKWSD